jgi:mannose-6-phosphate isomerase-like protein (cupin superfamily)
MPRIVSRTRCNMAGSRQMECLRITPHTGHAPGYAKQVRSLGLRRKQDPMIVVDVRAMPPEQWRLGVEARMLVSASNGATQLCIFEQWIAPGAGAPTHTHPVEEVLTVREGEAEMWIDDRRITVLAGQSLVVPANRVHGFRNSGTVTLHIHAVLASPVFEAMVEGETAMTRRWGQ